jgi:hypothetical protein
MNLKSDDMEWKKMNRDLERDEIIRTYLNRYEKINGYSKPDLNEPDCPFTTRFGKYLYGRNRGGFGSKMKNIGNAIFVSNVSPDFDKTATKESKVYARWERQWGIETMEK